MAARVLAVTAVTAGTAVIGVGTARAMPTDQLQCNADQLTTTAVPQSPGAGQRGIELQFTAKSGRKCRLSGAQAITLTDAAGVKVVPEDPDSFPLVTVATGKPAHELLHWGSGDMADHAVTPASIRIHTTGARGDVITLPWRFGSVAAVPAADTLDVGVVEPGRASEE